MPVKEIIEKAPEIIKESAKSPLGTISLAILLFSVVAIVFFQNSSGVVKGAAFASFAFGLLVFTERAVYYGMRRPNTDQPSDVTDHDRELFSQFLALFAEDDKIRFFKEQDFLGSFRKEWIDPLYGFVETWDNAAHEFVDQKIEKKRKEIYESAQKLASAVTQYTTPNGAGLISVKPDSLPPGPTPDWVKDQAEEMNQLATEFSEKHEDFVRFCRGRLS